MKIERLDRLVIVVKDLEKATKLFSDLLNTKFDHPMIEEGLKGKGRYDIRMGIELLAPTSPEGLVSRFLERRGEGVYAVVFKVHNLKEAMSEMEEKGVRLVNTIEIGKVKEAIYHPKDLHGVMIVLCEYEDWHPAVVQALHFETTPQQVLE